MIVKSITACLGFVCLAHPGHAQVVSGFSHLQGTDYAFHNETNGAPGGAIPEVDVEVYGMAADDANSTIELGRRRREALCVAEEGAAVLDHIQSFDVERVLPGL